MVWWCGASALRLRMPDEDTPAHEDLRRDAVYFLRSQLRSRRGFSVLQYAGHLGLTPCVQAMLTHENVFVRKLVPKYKQQERNVSVDIRVNWTRRQFGSERPLPRFGKILRPCPSWALAWCCYPPPTHTQTPSRTMSDVRPGPTFGPAWSFHLTPTPG